MSNPTTLDYAGRSARNCPICYERPIVGKTLFGHAVCKKCFYRFINRRQVAYIIDSLLFAVPSITFVLALAPYVSAMASAQWQVELMDSVIGLGLNSLFIMKDGFNGQSPGKWLASVQVVDNVTLRPISFGQSFKRNWFFLLGVLPIAGPWITLVFLITILIQMGKGRRAGDRFAGTRVIWKKHADSPVFGDPGIHCRNCGYDLTGNLSGVCPECGSAATPEAAVVPS